MILGRRYRLDEHGLDRLFVHKSSDETGRTATKLKLQPRCIRRAPRASYQSGAKTIPV